MTHSYRVSPAAHSGPTDRPSYALRLRLVLGAIVAILPVSCSRPAVVQPPRDGGHLTDVTQLALTRRGGQAMFITAAGTITGETRPNQRNSFLCFTPQCNNYILRFEVNTDATLNSGVQIRSQLVDPGTDREAVVGYQVEIDPTARAWSGGIYEEGKRGWLEKPPEEARAAFIPGAWNSYIIRCENNQIRTWVNDVACADYTDATEPVGLIGFQVHSVGADPIPRRVRWKNISIECLP